MSRPKNVFEAILRHGHDEDFIPEQSKDFVPTEAPAGSPEKIEELRRRVEKGQPLWHAGDRVDHTGLVASIVPRIDQVGTVKNQKKSTPTEKAEKPAKAKKTKKVKQPTVPNTPKPEVVALDSHVSVVNDVPSKATPSIIAPESNSEVAVATELVQAQVQKLCNRSSTAAESHNSFTELTQESTPMPVSAPKSSIIKSSSQIMGSSSNEIGKIFGDRLQEACRASRLVTFEAIRSLEPHRINTILTEQGINQSEIAALLKLTHGTP